jgi:hypothetical protein
VLAVIFHLLFRDRVLRMVALGCAALPGLVPVLAMIFLGTYSIRWTFPSLTVAAVCLLLAALAPSR